MNSYNGFSPAQRNRAQAWLRDQWARGLRPRPSVCCACGQDQGVIDAHAEDYSEPFGDHTDSYPLCYRCHMMVHCRFRNRRAWDRYRGHIRAGLRFAPLYHRNFGQISAQLAGAIAQFSRHPPPTKCPLDEIHEASPARRRPI
jgi:hypothetical protein